MGVRRRRGKGRCALAGLLVSVGLLVGAPGALAGIPGKISGTVTSAAAGHAVIPGVEVSVLNSTTHEFVGSASSDVSGKYEVTNLPAPGSYKVEFQPGFGSKFLGQFYNDVSTFAAAETLALAEGETKSVNAELHEGGTISGVVTSPGGPLGGVEVDVFPVGVSELIFGAFA